MPTVLWQDDTGKLDIDKCYKLEDVVVGMYQYVKYLSVSHGALISPIDDIGETATSGDLIPNAENLVLEGEIAAVVSCDEYRGCLSCKTKVTVISPFIAECFKCGTKMKLDRCKLYTVATVLFCTLADDTQYKVTLFHNEIKIITDKGMECQSGQK